MKNISLKHRLIIPRALLGLVALLSNILSITNIRNVNASASNIADNYMDGQNHLAQICQSSMNIHKMALSHIVATDYNTMIALVQQIKEAMSYQKTTPCMIPSSPITPLSNTPWSAWSAPAQAIRPRRLMPWPTGMWLPSPTRWKQISVP